MAKSGKPKPCIGETLFCIECGNAVRYRDARSWDAEVVKVGRKYFTIQIQGTTLIEFNIENWHHKSQYSAGYCLYRSEQEWKEEQKLAVWRNQIHDKFSYLGYIQSLSAQQCQQIAEIIGLKLKEI